MTSSLRWIPLILILLAGVAFLLRPQPPIPETGTEPPSSSSRGHPEVEALHAARTSGVMVEIGGRVDRLLADDREGSRHQRFILRLPSGHTLLISHNIDLVERVPIEVGDRVDLRGQYEWNERGGVVHWTHHDPQGRRPGGWIRHRDRTYR